MTDSDYRDSTEESKSPERRRDSDPDPEVLIGELLEDLPPDKQAEVRAIISQFYSGPVPPPWMLEQFNRVVPGSAKQILDDAHLEHVHRRGMEKDGFYHARDMDRRQLAAGVWESRVGQILAFIISILVIGSGTWLIYNDKSGYGFALIILELVGLAGAFLYNDLRQRSLGQQAQENLSQPTQDEEEASE